MAAQVTRWRPDTCECVVLIHWDDAAPGDPPTFSYQTQGPEHDDHTAEEVHFENRRKNLAKEIARVREPSLRHDQISWTVTGRVGFRRVLRIGFPSGQTTVVQRALMTTDANAAFGISGLVVFAED